jgi:hypothetical protein
VRRALARRSLTPALLALALAVTACASANRIEGGVFHSSKGYAVSLPGGEWQVASGTDADLELRRVAPAAGMLADATCEGRIAGQPAPLLVRHLTFGLKHRTEVRTEEVVVKGRRGARTTLQGTLDGREVAVDAVTLKEDGCVYDFLYVAPVDQFEAGRLEFQVFVESLKVDSEGRR